MSVGLSMKKYSCITVYFRVGIYVCISIGICVVTPQPSLKTLHIPNWEKGRFSSAKVNQLREGSPLTPKKNW